jgi:hypothetical protein
MTGVRRWAALLLALIVISGGVALYTVRLIGPRALPPLLAGTDWGKRQNDDPVTAARTVTDEAAFRAMLSQAFPVGSSTQALTQRLTSEGFTVSPGHAVFELSDLMCVAKWQIVWIDTGGVLDAVDGTIGRVCL